MSENSKVKIEEIDAENGRVSYWIESNGMRFGENQSRPYEIPIQTVKQLYAAIVAEGK